MIVKFVTAKFNAMVCYSASKDYVESTVFIQLSYLLWPTVTNPDESVTQIFVTNNSEHDSIIMLICFKIVKYSIASLKVWFRFIDKKNPQKIQNIFSVNDKQAGKKCALKNYKSKSWTTYVMEQREIVSKNIL